MTDRLIRLPEVENRTGLRRSAIYRYIQQGDFPAPIKLTPKASAWVESEIQEWIAARIRKARGESAGEV